MIVTTFMLFSWIAGVFSNKKIDEESPEDVSSYNAPEIEMNNKDNQTPEVQIPEPLSNPENDAPEEIISSDNIPTIVQMDKDLDNEKPEVQIPEPLSHPQQPEAEVEIANNKKILDAIEQSWRALLLAQTNKPDESDEDSDESDDEGVAPSHFFANAEIRNQTEPDDSDGEVEMAAEATEEEYAVIPCPAVPLAEANLPQVSSSSTGQEDWDAIVPESPSQTVTTVKQIPKSKSEKDSPKRFTFKVIKLPNLQPGVYLSLCLNERNNDGKIIKKKILSSRDPQWKNQKRFIFDVLVKNNPEDATITCKLKQTALLGMLKLTGKMKTTKLLGSNENIELLTGFKVAEVIKSKKK
jgi:hypothetical protein